jgi:arylsulfatase A-like enzyme
MTTMLTGRYPLDYGGHWYIEESQPTMAEQFKRNGYTTGAIHSNPNVSRLRNFDRGFDTFEENILPLQSDGLLDRAPHKLVLYANKFVRLLRRTPYMPAERVNRRLADWVNDTTDPWFLWTQYMDVHGPYLPGDDFSYRNKIRAERLWRKAAVNAPDEVTEAEHDELWENYRLEVEYLDREIGRFLDRLEQQGDLENTAVVVVGDHGDEFYEHGTYGHGNLPYDVLTHVPLVVRLPDSAGIEQGRAIDAPVRCIDVLPTMLDLADADLDSEMEERMGGESLLPLLEGDATQPTYEVVVTEKEMRGADRLRFGFRTSDWKFLFDGKNGDRFLYNLRADPGETTDVADDHPEVVERFETRLEERFQSIEQTSAGIQIPDIEDAPGVEERLKALGYQE